MRRRVLVALLAAATVVSAAPALAATARDIGDACPPGIVPEGGFTDTADLPEGIRAAIDCILGYGITQGTSADTFSPSDAVTRGQMATFLLSTLESTTTFAPESAPADGTGDGTDDGTEGSDGGTGEDPDAFADDDGTTHESSINALAALGIVKGTGPGTFSPGADVTRAQMATFVAASIEAVTGSLPAATTDHFPDDQGSTHEANINALADLGVVAGDPSGDYRPGDSVARRQMALFLARSLDLLVEQGFVEPPFSPIGVSADLDEPLSFGQEAVCTVTTKSGVTVELMVLPPENVTRPDAGSLRFADVDVDGIADPGALAPYIARVDGASQPADAKEVHGVASDGQVEVVLSSTDEGQSVLVAYIDEGPSAGALDLDLHGEAVEPVAVGCRAAWVPPEAVLGTHDDVTIRSVDVTTRRFTGSTPGGAAASFFYDDGDTFGGETLTPSDFDRVASIGDIVDVDYSPDPEGTSAFDLHFDTVLAPGTPKATATNLDDGSTRNDIEIEFSVPAHNGSGTMYRIERTPTSTVDGGCLGDVAGQAEAVGTTSGEPMADMNLAAGCFMYKVWAVSAGSAPDRGTTYSAPVESGLPDEDETIRPLSHYVAVVSDASPAATLSSGDVVKIRFDERLEDPAAGTSITLRAGTDDVTLTNGSGATFTLNVGDEQIEGDTETVPRGWVLTIELTAAPSLALAYPADIVGHNGITDLVGNRWDIAASPDTEVGPG